MFYPDLNDGEFDLTVYVPTKGRPDSARKLEDQFYSTSKINSRLKFILSDNDSRLDDYLKLDLDNPIVVTPERPGFVSPLNLGYFKDRREVYSYAVGFMGDDHFPRTVGWDEILVNELLKMKAGFVYGDDGLQGENLPTQIVMSSDIPLALGFMTLPRLKHLYADNFWLDLGKAIGKIKYVPEAYLEHMHPGAGKAQIDAGYEFSGAYTLDLEDRFRYHDYKTSGELDIDARKVLGMLRRTEKL